MFTIFSDEFQWTNLPCLPLTVAFAPPLSYDNFSLSYNGRFDLFFQSLSFLYAAALISAHPRAEFFNYPPFSRLLLSFLESPARFFD